MQGEAMILLSTALSVTALAHAAQRQAARNFL